MAGPLMTSQSSAPFVQCEHSVFGVLDDVETSLRYLCQQLSVFEELTQLPELSIKNKTVELPREALAAVFRNLCWSAEAINEKVLDVHQRLHEMSKSGRP